MTTAKRRLESLIKTVGIIVVREQKKWLGSIRNYHNFLSISMDGTITVMEFSP